MMEEDLLEEVINLSKTPLSKTAKLAIGYKELFAYLNGELTLDEAISKIKQNSRNYAKRQLTWFRNKDYINIVNIDSINFDKTIEEVEKIIDDFLK